MLVRSTCYCYCYIDDEDDLGRCINNLGCISLDHLHHLKHYLIRATYFYFYCFKKTEEKTLKFYQSFTQSQSVHQNIKFSSSYNNSRLFFDQIGVWAFTTMKPIFMDSQSDTSATIRTIFSWSGDLSIPIHLIKFQYC